MRSIVVNLWKSHLRRVRLSQALLDRIRPRQHPAADLDPNPVWDVIARLPDRPTTRKVGDTSSHMADDSAEVDASIALPAYPVDAGIDVPSRTMWILGYEQGATKVSY
jgi:hypothetical protein